MFNIQNSRDFYQKLVEDFDDFAERRDSARHAMNCAITAYHMHEWVWHDFLGSDAKLRKKLGISDGKGAFVNWIEKHSPWFLFIQLIANGSKHFVRTTAARTERVGGYGKGGFGLGSFGQSCLAIDIGTQKEPHLMSFAMLLEVVVRFWRDFMRNHCPHTDIYRGREKLMDEQG